MKDGLIIIDTLSHGPLVWNDTLIASSDRMLASGVSPFRIVQELTVQMARMRRDHI